MTDLSVVALAVALLGVVILVTGGWIAMELGNMAAAMKIEAHISHAKHIKELH